MKIKHIAIKNFRGIKKLDWKVTGDFICLIGTGDSTKSTILDAIECALTPKWNYVFEDTDFFNPRENLFAFLFADHIAQQRGQKTHVSSQRRGRKLIVFD